MLYLTTAVVIVGALCALDLVLTLGVIRRLREHTDLFSAIQGRPSPQIGPAVGDEIGAFSTPTVAGDHLTEKLVTDVTLVAFFSPGCRPCHEKLPKFVSYARAVLGGRDRVLVAVVGDQQEAAPFVADLSPVAQVVVEDPDGPLSTAFRATSYPLTLWVAPDGGGRLVVTASDVDLDQSVAAPV